MYNSIIQQHTDRFSMTTPPNYYRVISIDNSKKQITAYISHIDKNVNIEVDTDFNIINYTKINPSIVMDSIGLSIFEPRLTRPFVRLPVDQRLVSQCEYDYWYYCNTDEYEFKGSNGIIWQTITNYIKKNHNNFKSLDLDNYVVKEVLEDGCMILVEK
jgi:hypothetical protein